MLRDPGREPLFESLLGDPHDDSREKAAEAYCPLDFDSARAEDLKRRCYD